MRRITKDKSKVVRGVHRQSPARHSHASTASTRSSVYSNLETTEYNRSVEDRSERSMDRLEAPIEVEDNVFADVGYQGQVKGVVELLGTRQGSSDFSNPAYFDPTDPNLVVLRASSRIEGDLASLTAYRHEDGAFFETDSALSSWVSIELPLNLKITHYSLGYYVKGDEHVPRNWVSSLHDEKSW